MHRIVARAALLSLASLFISSIAEAGARTATESCLEKSEAFSLSLRISGCTSAIESHRYADEQLFWLLYNRGNAYLKTNRYDLAITDFDLALRIDPASPYALANRGTAYARRGEFAKAIADFDQAIALNPNHALIYSNRGSAYAKLGKYEAAVADFDQALRLDPKDASTRKNRNVAKQLSANLAQASRESASKARQGSATPVVAASVEGGRKEDRAQPREAAVRTGKAAARTARVAAATADNRSKFRTAHLARSSKRSSVVAKFFRQTGRNIRKLFRTVSLH